MYSMKGMREPSGKFSQTWVSFLLPLSKNIEWKGENEAVQEREFGKEKVKGNIAGVEISNLIKCFTPGIYYNIYKV